MRPFTESCSQNRTSPTLVKPSPSSVTGVETKSKPTQQPVLSGFVTRKLSDAEHSKLDSALLYCIAKDMQPVSVVEDEGFVKYSRALNAAYQLPSRKTVSRMLETKYDLIKAETVDKLKQVRCVNLTTDMWTSRATQGYLALTAHGLTDNFEFVSVLLETVHMPQSHSGENMADEIMSIVDSWGLKGKVVAIVTDNASSAVTCVSRLIKKGYAEMHLRCNAHTLQLSVGDITEADGRLLEMQKRCKQTVSLFHHSVVLSAALTDAQRQAHVVERKLIQSVLTRWNSSFLMYERMVEQETAVLIALCSYKAKRKKGATISKTVQKDDFAVMRSLVEVLAPFEEATRILSGESYVTSSVVHPLVEHLVKALDILSG